MLKIRRSHDRLIFNTGITISEKDSLYVEKGMGIPILKIIESSDRLTFNMAIPIPWKDGLYNETGPRTFPSWSLISGSNWSSVVKVDPMYYHWHYVFIIFLWKNAIYLPYISVKNKCLSQGWIVIIGSCHLSVFVISWKAHHVCCTEWEKYQITVSYVEVLFIIWEQCIGDSINHLDLTVEDWMKS